MRLPLIITILLSFLTVTATPADSISVGLVTCYPGADIYQLEGHSAIHIKGRIDGQPIDAAINYGVFDFNSPGFVYRFVKGETDYWCAIADWERFIAQYIYEGRRVVEHPIPLDSIQAQRLIALLNDNLLPQNRVYRYNYVKDNCATRPLRIIERAIGDSIILPEPALAPEHTSTFRKVMQWYHRNYPWYQFGIDLALGSGIDYQINAREKTFAPALLCQQLDSATVGGKKLTSAPHIINIGIEDVTLSPTPWYLTPTTISWVLFVITLAMTIYDLRRKRVSRWYDAILYAIYGIAGLVLTFLIFVSVHEATSPNWLYLWLNPLCLIVPIFIWLKKCKKIVMSYQYINFALILTMIVIWPWTGQVGNATFVPLIGCDLLRSASYAYIEKRK